MNKDQFFHELQFSLKRLPSEERQDILQDYEEHFNLALEEGKTEAEISKALGSPQQIAKELLANYHLEKVETTMTTGNIMRATLAVIALGFFNLLIVLGPLIALAAVLFAGWAVSLTFVVSPLLILANLALSPGAFEIFELFISLALCGIGIFIGIGMYFATKAFSFGFIRYLKFNASLVKGGLKNE